MGTLCGKRNNNSKITSSVNLVEPSNEPSALQESTGANIPKVPQV
jgi:hypothetical protein